MKKYTTNGVLCGAGQLHRPKWIRYRADNGITGLQKLLTWMNRNMSFRKAWSLLIFVLVIQIHTNVSNAQAGFVKPTNKMLVVSGGGARGAWGVGVASELYKKNGGYKAVFGTSTGSLMAPFILLQKYDELEKAYSSVTQKKIFSQNPFKVTYNKATGEVHTSLRIFKIITRLICGKKTFGETKNLLKLIKEQINSEVYAALIKHAREDNMVIGVAVTNTRTANVSLITDSLYDNTEICRDSLCRWIWASANEPLFMSYTQMGDSYYVDGGVREVIPVEEAVRYAAAHNLDTIDVIVNNSRIPENQNWDINSGGMLAGLKRLLSIYNLSTVQYNENYAYLLNLYHTATDTFPTPLAAKASKTIVMRFYFMPKNIAQKYADELGFIEEPMQALIKEGKKYAVENPNGNSLKIDNAVDMQLQSLKRNAR